MAMSQEKFGKGSTARQKEIGRIMNFSEIEEELFLERGERLFSFKHDENRCPRA